MSWFRKKEVVCDEFVESEHPRAENGQFTNKGGEGSERGEEVTVGQRVSGLKDSLKSQLSKEIASNPKKLRELAENGEQINKLAEVTNMGQGHLKNALNEMADELDGKGSEKKEASEENSKNTKVHSLFAQEQESKMNQKIRDDVEEYLLDDEGDYDDDSFYSAMKKKYGYSDSDIKKYKDSFDHYRDEVMVGDSKQEKVGVVMKEFKEGELKSGSGKKVTDPKQAIAIALSEAKEAKDEKEIPDEQEKPEKAGEENALVKGEEEMTEEVKEALAEKEVEKVKEAEDACGKAKDEKDEKLESKKDFAEGVKYGEEKEKEEPKKLDSEHESEGMKKAEKKKAEEEAEDEDKEEKKEDKTAKDSALAMDIDAIKQAVREEMKADFKAREDARKAVRSIVGDVNVMTFDSAEDIYKFACEQAGMDVNDIVSYKDAFKGLTAGKSKLALDASSISGSDEECFKDIRIA